MTEHRGTGTGLAVPPRESHSGRLVDYILKSSFDGMFAFDLDLRLQVFNPAMERLWGRRAADVLGRSVLAAFPFLVAIGEDEYFAAALRGESVVARDRPYRVLTQDSASFFGARYSPILDDFGTIVGGLAVVRDTTDHTYNASRIDRDRERLHALMGSANDFIFFKDLQGQYTAINVALAGFLGIDDPGTVVGKTDHDLYPRNLADQFQEDDERVLRLGESIVNRLEKLTGPDGSERWWRTNRAPIFDDEGIIIGLVGTARDATKQEQAESELRNERELLQTLIDNVPDLIFFKDAHSRFTRVNRAHALSMGCDDPRLVVGKTDADFYPSERAEEFSADEARLIATGIPIINKLERQSAPGYEPRWSLTSKVPVKDELGTVIGLVGTARDVTQIHQAEEELLARTAELEVEKERAERASDTAREASRLKSEFLSTMSHELRTPMNAIIGYAHFLLDGLSGELTEQQAADVGQIARSADQLLSLINDVLDLSKIEAGRMDLTTEVIDVGPIATQVVESLTPQAKAKGIQIGVDVGPGVQPIEADPIRIRQILLNLVSNAVKFTDHGSVSVAIRTSKNAIGISVTDTGIGIPAEAVEYIFDEFRQADGSTTRRFGGTGLGLAIARKFARLHGGDITLESAEGKGSCFTFQLPNGKRVQTTPLKLDLVEVSKAETKEPSDATTSASTLTVLLVEDDPGFVSLVRRTLERRGITVIHVSRGSDAIIVAMQLQPDLVLLDIGLEDGVDGWEVLKRIRSNPATQNLKVVVLSALDERGIASELGVADYFVKPIAMEELLGAIARIDQSRLPYVSP